MPTAIDLFCGCGGLSLGFQNAGFTILRAFDIWDKAINNYNLNFSHPAELQDINQLSPDYLKSFSPDVIMVAHHVRTILLPEDKMKHTDEPI